MKTIYRCYLFVLYFFIYFSCYIKLSKLCAYLIKISLIQNKNFSLETNSKKLFIVLDRSIGRRDVEIIFKSLKKPPNILFMRRTIAKVVFFYFCNKNKLFFNYLKPKHSEQDYFRQKKNDKKEHEEFWVSVMYHLKKIYKNKNLNFITFNFTYYTEAALYAGCNKNKIPVKLWHKECFMSDPDVKYRIKVNKFKNMFKFFDQISVYNNFIKEMLIKMEKSNRYKISVNGSPRVYDFIDKKRYFRKVKNILFLAFNSRTGIPPIDKHKSLNWKFSYDKVIKLLNELSKNKNQNIIIKRKNSSSYKSPVNVSKNIKIFEQGTAEKFINKADIIIGHNSGSTIEALLSGKHVMVPFFENNTTLKKFLYNFDKSIIFTSEKKMKKHLQVMIDRKISFPLKNIKSQKTISYYLGNHKNIKRMYLKFLNA